MGFDDRHHSVSDCRNVIIQTKCKHFPVGTVTMWKRTFLFLLIATGFAIALGAGFPASEATDTIRYTGPADLIPLSLFLSLALGVSFLCSVLEAVLLSVGPGQVQMMVEEGQKSGLILKKVRSNLDRSLSAILTLNTVAHTAGAAGVGAEVARVFGSKYLALASVILTLLVLVLSEIIPKTLGARHARTLAGKSALLIHWLSLLLLPVVLRRTHPSGHLHTAVREKR
ncbi:MAG: DUF21 domain-containing protein [Planctomycetaceae bacterium]